MPILVKSDDVRSGRKAKALHGLHSGKSQRNLEMMSTANMKAIFSFLPSMNLEKLEGKNCVQILGLFSKSAKQKLKLIFISPLSLFRDYYIIRGKKNLFSSIDPYISSHCLNRILILQLPIMRNSPSVGQQLMSPPHHDDCPSHQRSHQEFKHEPATPDNHICFMGNPCRTCHYERQKLRTLEHSVTNQKPRNTTGYCLENNGVYCFFFLHPRWRLFKMPRPNSLEGGRMDGVKRKSIRG